MRVGLEGNHLPEAKTRGGIQALDFAHAHGTDGVAFKSILDLSPTLDPGELREARAHADALGLYLEVGVGRVNPYNTAESPEVRRLGGGDYKRAIEMMIRAAREIGCTEMWAETATYKKDLSGYFVYDRFRTDVTWADQLTATCKFLASLAPVLRDLGSRIDVETHEEITSFELVRLVEAVGPEVAGVTFDTANVLARAEDPVAAARRLAPYTHLVHAKDAILYFDEKGLVRDPRPCGQGVIDWEAVISILAEYSPDLNLSIEDYKGLMWLYIFDPGWQAGHPDLTVRELAEIVRLAKVCENKIRRGEIMDPAAYLQIPYEAQKTERMNDSLKHLRGILQAKGLAE